VPLGILAVRRGGLRRSSRRRGIIQTIPSLALFGFLLPVPYIAASARGRRWSR
jgi:ABC-type proline/glycine betaine transport system permease subunit